jgi:phenylpyruvate tautomerase PptA (4-oxalocrotonate tautomerase family)
LPFDYYKRLSPARQSVYRQSDAIAGLTLKEPAPLRPLAAEMQEALAQEQQRSVESLAQRIADAIVEQLNAPRLRVQVLAVRPSDDWGELHGLYLPEDAGKPAKIQLWMRTAKHKRVVAFRSFLRTLLHEICHHLDYELFHFPETFHTEGFYSRESSLFHQLVPEAAKAQPAATARQRS